MAGIDRANSHGRRHAILSRREYCAGAGESSTFAVGAHSEPWSSATTMHQCVLSWVGDQLFRLFLNRNGVHYFKNARALQCDRFGDPSFKAVVD